MYLRIHAQTHENNIFSCDQCEAFYSTKKSLWQHKNRFHKLRQKCEICGSEFRPFYYKDHMKRHLEKKFLCAHCPSSFVAKCDIKQHLEIHQKFKKFNCSKCDRGFHKKCYYQEHLLTHVNPRPFQCKKCSKDFITSQSYIKHSCQAKT